VVPVSSTRAAELTKLLENIHRAVNIGLVNEMKIIADRMDIDIHEVIRAAATKPFGFTPYYPGPGLGGHCIPIDPFYLTWKAREYGLHTRFIELAGEINSDMPHWVIGKVTDALNRRGKSVMGSRVLVLGIAYKKDVEDMRESPSVELMEILREKGAVVDYADPHVPSFPRMREHHFDLKSVELNPSSHRFLRRGAAGDRPQRLRLRADPPVRRPDRRYPRGLPGSAAERRESLRTATMRHYPAPIQDRKIRFALVGCGRIANNHFDALRQHHERAQLVGVCDVDPRALDRAVGLTGAEGYASLEEMLRRLTPTSSWSRRPSGLHPEQTVQIAASGRHVMTEKPMATRWEDGKRMVAAADAAGMRLFVVKQNRRNATLQLLKNAQSTRSASAASTWST
jgi:hypothetical protein